MEIIYRVCLTCVSACVHTTDELQSEMCILGGYGKNNFFFFFLQKFRVRERNIIHYTNTKGEKKNRKNGRASPNHG